VCLQQRVANKESKILEVELDDIREHFSAARDSSFIDRVMANTLRYVELMAVVCDQNMPKPSVNFREEDLTSFDVLMQQRRYNLETNMQNAVN
jgi:hypothetical protein